MIKNIQKKMGVLSAERNYKPVHLLLMFFIFSVVGWVWEVMLGYVTGGVLVNRGVLHSPLLPIYGKGVILILVLLKRFRKYPVAEFAGIIFLSGCVEYFISWYLEMVYDGKRWWDYSDYWLNLNGRICAEGLILFGFGGMFVVYVAAPFLDNKMQKMNPRYLMILAVALLVIYAGDSVYSVKYPNTGVGITECSANEKIDYYSITPIIKNKSKQENFCFRRDKGEVDEHSEFCGAWYCSCSVGDFYYKPPQKGYGWM